MNIARKWDGQRQVLLTIDDYALLERSGALAEYGRTELIEGVIIAMNAQFRPHARVKGELAFRFRLLLDARADGLAVLTEASVAVPPRNMPEPDVVLTTEPEGEGPIPIASVKLIVEISNDTLNFDLGDKAVLYAGGGIPEYWVVDIDGERVTIHTGPTPDGYERKREVVFGDLLVSDTIDGLAIASDGLR